MNLWGKPKGLDGELDVFLLFAAFDMHLAQMETPTACLYMTSMKPVEDLSPRPMRCGCTPMSSHGHLRLACHAAALVILVILPSPHAMPGACSCHSSHWLTQLVYGMSPSTTSQSGHTHSSSLIFISISKGRRGRTQAARCPLGGGVARGAAAHAHPSLCRVPVRLHARVAPGGGTSLHPAHDGGRDLQEPWTQAGGGWGTSDAQPHMQH